MFTSETTGHGGPLYTASTVVINAMMWDKNVAAWIRERGRWLNATGQLEYPLEPCLGAFNAVIDLYDETNTAPEEPKTRALNITRLATAVHTAVKQWSLATKEALRENTRLPQDPYPRDYSVPAHIAQRNEALHTITAFMATGRLTDVASPATDMTPKQAWGIAVDYGKECVRTIASRRALANATALLTELRTREIDNERATDPIWDTPTPEEPSPGEVMRGR